MHTEYGIKYVHAAREDSRRVQFDCPSDTGGAPKTVYRRLGVLKWKASATPDQIKSASSAVIDIFKNAAGILRVAAGPNLKIDIRPDLNWDFAVTADFESLDAFKTYRDSKAHIEASQRHVVPVLEGAHNVICEWPF